MFVGMTASPSLGNRAICRGTPGQRQGADDLPRRSASICFHKRAVTSDALPGTWVFLPNIRHSIRAGDDGTAPGLQRSLRPPGTVRGTDRAHTHTGRAPRDPRGPFQRKERLLDAAQNAERKERGSAPGARPLPVGARAGSPLRSGRHPTPNATSLAPSAGLLRPRRPPRHPSPVPSLSKHTAAPSLKVARQPSRGRVCLL